MRVRRLYDLARGFPCQGRVCRWRSWSVSLTVTVLPHPHFSPLTHVVVGIVCGSRSDAGVLGSDDSDSDGSDRSKSSGATAVPTRFHARRELTTNRVVRDAGQIYEEIVSHFVTSGVPVRVTLDIESEHLDRLTEDQRTAIRENLKTLGFADDDWGMS